MMDSLHFPFKKVKILLLGKKNNVKPNIENEVNNTNLRIKICESWVSKSCWSDSLISFFINGLLFAVG